jgi:tRNA-binding protein
MSLAEELQRLGVTVGRIVGVADHPGARAPAYLLTLDLGAGGRHECSVPSGDYQPSDLDGTQVVCARAGDEVVVIAAHSHARGLVFLRPDREVEDGSVVA